MIKKVGIIIFLLLVLLLAWLLDYTTTYIKSQDIILPTISNNEKYKPITLFFVGDMMLNRGVSNSVNKNLHGDFSKVFENVPELKQADITFGNLEGPITTSNDRRGSIYSFKMEPVISDVLKNAGFDIVSFANNHVGDYGQEGFSDTINYLNNSSVLFTGAGLDKTDASTARIIEIRGKKIGFLGFTDVGPNWMKATDKSSGILLASDPDFEKIISSQKERVDYLVVSIHWGEEYKVVNDRQRELATRAVVSGADIIVGHHPHVIQEDIVINGKPVIFSLGNFIFDQTTPEQTKIGMVAAITIDKNGSISLDKFASSRDKYLRPSHIRLLEENDVISENENQIIDKNTFECPKPNKSVETVILTSFPRKKALVNYIPGNLVLLPKKYSLNKNICVSSVALEAFELMQKDMNKKSLKVLVRYAFRSNDSQEALISSFIERGKGNLVAPLGQSEHILGTAFDLASGTSMSYFSESNEYKYLKENAYKYGFVQSFNGDPSDENHIPNEPWHWRYVGVKIATTVKRTGLPVNLFLKSN